MIKVLLAVWPPIFHETGYIAMNYKEGMKNIGLRQIINLKYFYVIYFNSEINLCICSNGSVDSVNKYD
ncbi:hypothetical protein FB379_101111 [Aeribacillus composti]|jgi:hypothetical protein|nr:hypothetical protein A3Q35_10730 [Aeribacillus pallidus]TVZ89210.1 hypothetical protein FB379_101111 [Aeribacillus composti]